jgi:hypothetical protein
MEELSTDRAMAPLFAAEAEAKAEGLLRPASSSDSDRVNILRGHRERRDAADVKRALELLEAGAASAHRQQPFPPPPLVASGSGRSGRSVSTPEWMLADSPELSPADRPPSQQQQQQQRIEKLEGELRAERTRREDAEQQVAAAQRQMVHIQGQLATVRATLADYECAGDVPALVESEAQLRDVRRQRNRLQEELITARAEAREAWTLPCTNCGVRRSGW